MKNANLPSMPVDVAQLYESQQSDGSWENASLGLTKREEFTKVFLAAMLSNSSIQANIGVGGRDNKKLVLGAIELANVALEELERTKND